MKFYGEPNSLVKINSKTIRRSAKIKGFRFDKNGEYETDNEFMIRAMKRKFKYEEVLWGMDNEVPFIKIENNADTGEEIKLKHCKKCDFTCENMGDLLAHYRTAHPKTV
jgi:hypothetical protein